MLRLQAVIEVEPGRFAPERGCPTAEAPDEEWDVWFLACLAEAGITDLSPFRPRSWLVDAEELTRPDTIERLLVEHLGKPLGEAVADRDCWHALDGGFVLLDDQRILVEPGCCGDLGNLEDWREAATVSTDGWKTLWIGHPRRSFRHAGPLVELSNRYETEKDGFFVEHRLDAAQLAEAVAAARPQLLALAARLRPVLAAGEAQAGELLDCLVGLKSSTG